MQLGIPFIAFALLLNKQESCRLLFATTFEHVSKNMHKQFPSKVTTVTALRGAVCMVYRKNVDNLALLKASSEDTLRILHSAYEAAMEFVNNLYNLLDETTEEPALNFLTARVYAIASSPSITGALALVKALAVNNTLQSAYHLLEI